MVDLTAQDSTNILLHVADATICKYGAGISLLGETSLAWEYDMQRHVSETDGA